MGMNGSLRLDMLKNCYFYDRRIIFFFYRLDTYAISVKVDHQSFASHCCPANVSACVIPINNEDVAENSDLTAITELTFKQSPQLLEINFNKDCSVKLYEEEIT